MPMPAHINLTFVTSQGNARTIRIPHADAAATDAAVRVTMNQITDSNVLPNVVGRRSAQLVQNNVTEYDVTD